MGVSMAVFYAPIGCTHGAFSEEATECETDRSNCAMLKRTMYGAKAVSQNWQYKVLDIMIRSGFNTGRSSAVVLCDKAKDLRCMVHGDDGVKYYPL